MISWNNFDDEIDAEGIFCYVAAEALWQSV